MAGIAQAAGRLRVKLAVSPVPCRTDAMLELPRTKFDLYALALPRGHGFGDEPPVGAWEDAAGRCFGIATRSDRDGTFGVIVLRRRVDDVWIEVAREVGLVDFDTAKSLIAALLRPDDPPEPMPPGVRRRPPLHDLEGRSPGSAFRLLSQPSHQNVGRLLNQLYLALPRPDRNWVSDCQTANLHTRLWEAQLLASLREQGLLVTQPHESPDFRIENRRGGVAWVEAVTANPPQAYDHVNAPRRRPPTEQEEISFGEAAVRFAKTIGNKLQRRYDQLAHVKDHPFLLAIADFQAGASMTWSREALLGYLYGQGAEVEERKGRRVARATTRATLLGDTGFPAGLFADRRAEELSAVIFTNACSLGKFNRVMATMAGPPDGLRYLRCGEFFDRTPGALKGIPFCLDVNSAEYLGLWPHGYEPWNAELEVFHNPFARRPVPIELLPEATHWLEDVEGDLACRAPYPHAVLWSFTLLQDADDPIPSLDDLRNGRWPPEGR